MMPALSTLVTSLPYAFYNKDKGSLYSAGFPVISPTKYVKYELVFGQMYYAGLRFKIK